ncbi:hypothetical protein ACEV60_26660 [Enterobacter ludwigii]|uniref:hypothetical protein n=1 Tax=Enterobacter ludwigii TaxID=299767 RepID=UPI00242CDC53|nr:hypothetical protein [Enterobacter ludwigii]WGA04004.1 hypothetical protein NFK84_20380 [Enterobacter ludwigii]
MRQLSMGVLVVSLMGLGMASAVAAPMPTAGADTSSTIAPLITRGPGPVIAPKGSKYMEEKNAAVKKQISQHARQDKHHGKKNHHSKKKHHGKKHQKKK